MPTVKAFVRTTANKKDVNVRFRYTDGRNVQLFHTSEIIINPAVFDTKGECIKAKVLFSSEKRKQIDKAISERKNLIKDLCLGVHDKSILTSQWLENSIDEKLNPEKYVSKAEEVKRQSFFDAFDEFLQKRKLSDVRETNFMVLKRALQRYELYVSKKTNQEFRLDLDTITGETIADFEKFLLNEHALYDSYKSIYDKLPAIIGTNRKTSRPQQRGMNTINALFNKLRAFFNWCNDIGKTDNRPFRNYESTPDLYGTPVYITIDERNQIYNTDLSNRPSLAVQRDIFVFQCLIGCRVGDLVKMTKSNVINGAIEYIPRKTKDGHPVTVRVPLNDTAKEILKRYESDIDMLLPFISEQKYNDAIKDIFRFAGITRTVTVINPTTRNEEKRPINEIASSHLARRTFIGNLYKKVKDPNLVGALSGHTDGSKAFARYRDIDEEMKAELVKMLD